MCHVWTGERNKAAVMQSQNTHTWLDVNQCGIYTLGDITRGTFQKRHARSRLQNHYSEFFIMWVHVGLLSLRLATPLNDLRLHRSCFFCIAARTLKVEKCWSL